MRLIKSSDSRQNLRIVPDRKLPIRVDINGENFIDILNASDISLGGIGIHVPHGFEGCAIDRKVSFILELPDQCKSMFVKVEGHIRHLSGRNFGVSFHEISDIARQAIKRYVARQIKRESLADWLCYKVGLIS